MYITEVNYSCALAVRVNCTIMHNRNDLCKAKFQTSINYNLVFAYIIFTKDKVFHIKEILNRGALSFF